jgi:hypothetical protein
MAVDISTVRVLDDRGVDLGDSIANRTRVQHKGAHARNRSLGAFLNG